MGCKAFSTVLFAWLVVGNAPGILGLWERSSLARHIGWQDTRSHADLAQLIRRNGYGVEQHFAETEDGYVLGLFRILPSSGSPRKLHTHRPVVLQHGLLDSAATWVVNDATHSLGFILVDHGHDVWLANSRGNTFRLVFQPHRHPDSLARSLAHSLARSLASRNHTGFSTESDVFWDFSLDDMAAYDLPSTIEYVRRHTDSKDVALVAHSQGGALSLAALASGAIPHGHVSVLIALAPAVYLKYIESVPLQFLASIHADTLFKLAGRREFLPSERQTSDLFSEFCTLAPQQCVSILTAICGFNPSNVDVSRLPVYLAYAPGGTSVKNMQHWGQRVRDAASHVGFSKFDYGDVCDIGGVRVACNQHVYGRLHPPSYDLPAISYRSDDVKIAVLYGLEDKLADPIDIQTLISDLGDRVVFEKGLLGYQHIDFTWSTNAAEDVYGDVLRLLR
jgi:pimeloyl-ACP methyl ester carboxylesterase